MALTATITNLVKEEDAIRIFWQYSDGKEENSLFAYDTEVITIKAYIKTRLDELNSRDGRFANLVTRLSGVVLT